MKLLKGLLVFLLLLTIIITVVSRTQGDETNLSAPIISSSQDPLMVSCDYSQEDLLKGLTAYDAEDGYITGSIIPGTFTVFKEKGVSELDYFVYDSDNNCGRYKREVIFSDYSSPKVSLSNPLMFISKAASDGVLMNSLYGIDCLDGDVKHIKVNSSDIDYTRAGDYTISVSLINSFGDIATYDLPVHIIQKAAYQGLEIRLSDNLIYIETGMKFYPEDYVKEVEISKAEELISRDNWVYKTLSNGDASEDSVFTQESELNESDESVSHEEWVINILSNVDTSKAGVYEVRYLIIKEKDEDYGSVSGITWLTVIVED